MTGVFLLQRNKSLSVNKEKSANQPNGWNLSAYGSFTYSVAYKPAISFCVDTGFTLFGLVNQDYVLPEDVIREIGIDVFDYEQLEYDEFKPEGFQFSTFTPDKFEPEKIDMTFLRRGVIGINEIGFIE